MRFTDAVAAYDKAISRVANPPPGTGEISTTVVWPKSGRTNGRRRRRIFSAPFQLSPDQPFVLNYLGYSLADMGHQLDEARQMVQTAAERRPNDGAITDSLGWVQYRQGRTGSGQDPGTGSGAGAGGRDDQRPPGRRLLRRGSEDRGTVLQGRTGADAEPHAG